MSLPCVNNLVVGENLWCDASFARILILWRLWMARHFATTLLGCCWRASSLILASATTSAMSTLNTTGTVVTTRAGSTLCRPISWIVGTSTSGCVPTPLDHSYFIVAFTPQSLTHYRYLCVYLVICWQKLLLVKGIRTLILMIRAERYMPACRRLLAVFAIFYST